MSKPPKYSRYQDYVIKDGRLVGEFEEMYRDFADPWEQTTREAFAAEKAVALNAIAALSPAKVLELGCGLGHFTRKIKALGVPKVVGVDVSETAIAQARVAAPECEFVTADILDFQVYKKHAPDLIVMAEITWYILEKLPRFLEHVRATLPQTYLIHLLTTYPPGEQKYGKEFFTDLKGILKYFGMNYVEYGEIVKPQHAGCARTYFLGRYAALPQTRL
jgi:SAM-dependent methyltransferase